MMQPTPAPSSPPRSPPPQQSETEEPTYSAPPQNIDSAPFAILVGLFEKLSVERKQERRRKLLDAWFTHWRQEKGYDLYPVLRLLLPQKDRERAVYGLKEKNLAKTYIKLIPLRMRDPDAIRMLNWKKPTDREKASGDFPAVLYEVVSKRSSVIEGSLSIDDLNYILDELAQNMGKQDIQSKILQRVYNRSTAEEQRWIIRIILKDMQISVKETTVFSVFHPDAQDLYNTCSDLKKVAWELWDPSFRLNSENKTVQLFRVFAPMLCKRPTRKLEDTVREMSGSEFYIEEKLDGERMQLHRRGNEYFYCSRPGKDYTYLYGKHVGTGSLTPHIDQAFDTRIDDIILDGEMLVWDPVTERNLPFGTLKTAALDKSKAELNPRPCFKVFDLLHLNGQSLIHKPLSFRKRNLRHCLKQITGRIEFAVEYRGKTAKEIRERMDQVMVSRGEGLVIKHPLSKYVLNGRNMDWIKVCFSSHSDNMGETVDLLVVAGNYGTGKRGGGVSTLVCAVLDDRRNDEDDEEPKYSTFVRIGSGLSYADYVWVRDKPWKAWNERQQPSFLLTANRSHDDKGDVFLEPEDSFILKIKAAEIVPSDQYHMGFTMRFPRAMAIRDDLTVADCMTATAVLESLKTERKRKMDSDIVGSKKKRKTVAKVCEEETYESRGKLFSLLIQAMVLPQYQGPNLKDVSVQSDVFDGMKFGGPFCNSSVVVSDPKSRTGNLDRKELMKLIHAHGGTCAQIAKPDMFVVYGGSITPYDLKLVIDKNVNDVIKPSWIKDSIALGEPAAFNHKYFFHATAGRMNEPDYDEGGDEDKDMKETGDAAEENAEPMPLQSKEGSPKLQHDLEDLDPSLAEWFRGGKGSPSAAGAGMSSSETESDHDSDNADVAEESVDEDDWEKVKRREDLGESEEVEDVKMGEADEAMVYDEELIFKHLCFYLDTPENARRNGMEVKSKREGDSTERLGKIAEIIRANGGRIVDVYEPKLTHVVVDKRDATRRLELIKATSRPKRRHLVISEFIEACVEEKTLLDEDGGWWIFFCGGDTLRP
ncbi:DNA ligase 4 [Leucoagaricus sp. SymC.cos]|nr:DNA ligase 4 [Leucoagaricus sp. SymC.cos]